MKNHKRTPSASSQAGFSLLEVLISVLIFSLGVLALVNLQASAVRLGTDARLRADATFLADQLFARMLISAPADASLFAHRTTNGANCSPTGSAASAPSATEWLTEVAQTLPGAIADRQQIVVGADSQVTVSICWRQGEDEFRQLVVSNQIQWQ
jgi:type IV pilus assembly protein PilV